MSFTLTDVLDLGDDVLLVRASVDGRQEPVEARGWVSAMEQHYDPTAYGADGHRLKGAQPRRMTDAERRAYWERLIADVLAGEPAARPEPRRLL